MNKLIICGVIAIVSYFVYITQGPSTKLQPTGRQDYDQIIKVQSKDISECSIATDKDVMFHPKNIEMYSQMEQGCTYKIWVTGNSITEIEHVVTDGCSSYLPDSLHKF